MVTAISMIHLLEMSNSRSNLSKEMRSSLLGDNRNPLKFYDSRLIAFF